MTVGIEAADQGKPRIEDFLRAANYDAALVGVAARIQIQVPHLGPLPFRPLVEVAAEGSADVELARNERKRTRWLFSSA